MNMYVEWVKGQRSTREVFDETLSDVGEAVIAGVCNLRDKYPQTFRGGLLNPVMDRLCVENGHPPTGEINSASFTGGQCSFDYFVYLQVNFNSDGSPRIVQKTVKGAITGEFSYSVFGTFGSQNETTGWHVYIETSWGRSQAEIIYVPTGTPPPGNNVLKITSVVPKGGQPDDCGDPPVTPDPPIDPGDLNRTVEICGTPSDAENQRCVDVNIDFDPFLDENGNQCFTIEGQKYCFTPNGVEKQDDELPTEETPPSPDELEPTADEDTEESSEEDENIVYVTTEITTFPSSGKSVFHAGTGNNDYFAGHFNWTTSTSTGLYKHPSIPIRKQLQIYVKPKEATGYTTYTVNGAKIKVVKYKKPVEGE